jgi:WD40 repeat protein
VIARIPIYRQRRLRRSNHDQACSILKILISTVVVVSCAAHARAQGPPDIIWSSDYATGGPTSVAIDPNRQTVVSGESDKATELWFAANGAPLARLVQGQIGCGTVNDVAYSPDGQVVATINGCTLKLWSVATGALLRTINSGGGANAFNSHTSVVFSPDGQIVAASVSVAYGSGSVNFWRVSDGVLLRTLTGGGGTELAFSPDGQLVASIGLSRGAGLAIWRVSDGALLQTIPGVIDALAFSPDGELIATGGLAGGEFDGDATIEFYRISDGALVRRLFRTGGVGALAFTPDGQTLLSAGYEPNQGDNGYAASTAVIHVWRLSDGALLKTYDESTGDMVAAVAVAADGKSFAYVHNKATVLARMPDTTTAAPNFSIDPGSRFSSCEGDSGSVQVTAPAGCAWHARSRVSWITITSGSSGVGNGTVNYTVSSNGCPAIAGSDLIRQGQIVIAEQPFIVKQREAVSPAPTPNPTPTATPSPTPDETPPPTPEATPTPTPEATPTPTPEVTPTPTPEETPTPVQTKPPRRPGPVPRQTSIPLKGRISHQPAASFSVIAPIAAGGHPRVTLLLSNLKNADTGSLILEAEDAEHHTYPLVVEYVGKPSQFDSLSQVIVRLPDELASQERIWITIKARGAAINKLNVRIRPPIR